jgi:ABC-type maltose transport system permease subunit
MSKYGGNICQVMAGFALIAVPSAILYLSSQKLIVEKFQVGGLKG